MGGPRRSSDEVRADYQQALDALGVSDPDTDAYLGASREQDSDDTDLQLWPEHLETYALFAAMQTQWRVGTRGAIGLDYGVLTPVARAIGLPRRGDKQRFADLRVMEAAALRMIDSLADKAAEADRA